MNAPPKIEPVNAHSDSDVVHWLTNETRDERFIDNIFAEMCIRLQRAGYVEVHAKSGWSVRPIDFAALEHLYDEIWVYGCQSHHDPIREHQFAEAAARKVRFCGYLDIEPRTRREFVFFTRMAIGTCFSRL